MPIWIIWFADHRRKQLGFAMVAALNADDALWRAHRAIRGVRVISVRVRPVIQSPECS